MSESAKNQPGPESPEPARNQPGGEPARNQPGGEPAKNQPGGEPGKGQPGGQPVRSRGRALGAVVEGDAEWSGVAGPFLDAETPGTAGSAEIEPSGPGETVTGDEGSSPAEPHSGPGGGPNRGPAEPRADREPPGPEAGSEPPGPVRRPDTAAEPRADREPPGPAGAGPGTEQSGPAGHRTGPEPPGPVRSSDLPSGSPGPTDLSDQSDRGER